MHHSKQMKRLKWLKMKVKEGNEGKFKRIL